jgi:hypothetical protein
MISIQWVGAEKEVSDKNAQKLEQSPGSPRCKTSRPRQTRLLGLRSLGQFAFWESPRGSFRILL